MNVRIVDDAEADLLEGFEFYEEQAPGVGWYFLEALHGEIESLRLYAGVHGRQHGCYRMLSSRFPYAVYYKILDEEIVVWRILDCRRDPRWIRKQLRTGERNRE